MLDIKRHKKIVNFMFTTGVLDGPVTTNKKAHDKIASVSLFLCSDLKLSRFQLSKEKQKRFYVNML